MKEMNILLIAGCSGSGKTFIRDMIYNHKSYTDTSLNFHIPMQVTTRGRRVDMDGDFSERADAYIFLDRSMYDYLTFDNCLTTVTHFDDKFYGTLKKTLVSGKKNCNLIVASAEGIRNTIMDFENIPEVNIKTMLVVSNPEEIEDIIVSHNGRNVDFAKNEIAELMKIPFDVYIPNFVSKRVTEEELFDKIDFDKLFRRK